MLRRHPAEADDGVRWIHGVLGHLAATSFNAPVPVPYFDGESVGFVDGALWSAVSFVEGDVVGWATTPDMHTLGGYLATFHDVAAEIVVTAQRPDAVPVPALPGQKRRTAQVVHGDFTNHNVLAVDGIPCGAIDFMNAFVEVPLFDIGCALWRSGRPTQDSIAFDPGRIRDYVDGYSSVRPLSDEDRGVIVAYLRARGAQILEKQARRGIRDDGPRRRLEWLDEHEHELALK